MEDADLFASIEAHVRGSLARIAVTSIVCSRPALCVDEAKRLDITIHCAGTPSDVARAEPLGFLSGLRMHVARLGEDAFPLVHFRPSGAE